MNRSWFSQDKNYEPLYKKSQSWDKMSDINYSKINQLQ